MDSPIEVLQARIAELQRMLQDMDVPAHITDQILDEIHGLKQAIKKLKS